MGKAMRALGKRAPWHNSWLELDCRVSKKAQAAIARARVEVEKAEAQAALRKQQRAQSRVTLAQHTQ